MKISKYNSIEINVPICVAPFEGVYCIYDWFCCYYNQSLTSQSVPQVLLIFLVTSLVFTLSVQLSFH